MMDIRLKGEIDGITAADQIRLGHEVPVVFLTAHADAATLERAKVTEPFGYVVKPFEERELHTTIEVALYKFKMDRERARMVNDLQKALSHVKTLSGLLPICAGCKKVRNDHGYWNEVNVYLMENTEANISIGICPDCEKAYAEPVTSDL